MVYQDSQPWPSMVTTFEIEKCKTKIIQADLLIFTHILVYSCIYRDIQAESDILKNDSGIFRTLYNPGILRTLVCSEPSFIHNPGIFISTGIFRNLLCS